jgi:hypothetical protein
MAERLELAEDAVRKDYSRPYRSGPTKESGERLPDHAVTKNKA